MRFFSAHPWRTAAEVLLTVAILAFVAYDLTGHSSRPEPANLALSFEAKPAALPASKPKPARFEGTVVGVTIPNTFTVCGNTVAPNNPWVIGTSTGVAQALVVQLGGACIPNPSILAYNTTTNVSALAGIIVQPGSWLSFQNIMYPNGVPSGALSGPLVMQPGSYLEAVVSPVIDPLSKATAVYPLLLANGTCPSFVGVNFVINNCPVSAYTTGGYSCAISSANVVVGGLPYCSISLTIVGALTVASTQAITVQFARDCSTITVAQFQATIFQTTGVSAEAINVVSITCSSTISVFYVLGSNPALINAAVSAILAAGQRGGPLYVALGVLYIGLGIGVPTTYYPRPVCFYNGNNYCASTAINLSSSNPALFALLTLLVIPLAIILGAMVYCCLQKPPVCCAPICPPAPLCPCEPTCVMAAPDMCASPAAGLDTSASAPMLSSPLPYQPVMTM